MKQDYSLTLYKRALNNDLRQYLYKELSPTAYPLANSQTKPFTRPNLFLWQKQIKTKQYSGIKIKDEILKLIGKIKVVA